MVISNYPSVLKLPDKGDPRPIIDFLCDRFKQIDRENWILRFSRGLILDVNKNPLEPDSPTSSHSMIYYYKVVESEPDIPFEEKIILENERFLIACKPHFLPVIPTGPYLNECLLNRLRKKTDNPALIPANRIDRETAGLVMFVKDEKLRGRYQNLFTDGSIKKEYEAVVHVEKELVSESFSIEKRMVKAEPFFRMKSEEGTPNSFTNVEVIRKYGNMAHLKIDILTGKKHQIRVHLADEGLPIINDRYYPVLRNEPDDFNNPLQLLSKKLSFTDPVTSEEICVKSERCLKESLLKNS